MKSSENFSCWRIDFSIARSPCRIFISRSMRRSSFDLNKPIATSIQSNLPPRRFRPVSHKPMQQNAANKHHRCADAAGHAHSKADEPNRADEQCRSCPTDGVNEWLAQLSEFFNRRLPRRRCLVFEHRVELDQWFDAFHRQSKPTAKARRA